MDLSINLIPTNNSFQLDVDIDEKSNIIESQKFSNLIKKLDLRLIPYLTLLYLFSFLDRVNIGYARIYRMEEELSLTSTQYAWSLSIFFIGYVLFEIPSNLLLKRFSAGVWICRIMISWGLITIALAFVKNFAGLMAGRFFLGVAEAGLFPGIIYYLSFWYTREEQGLRIALFYSAASLAGAFSGVLAYGMSYIDGAAGLSAWKWIFIIEGMPSVLIGISTYWLLPSTPDKVKWLNEEERDLLINRLLQDHTDSKATNFRKEQFIEAITDYKVYLYMMISFGITCPLYSLAQLLPTIINQMGFSKLSSLLMSAPPYAVSVFTIIGLSFHSDKRRERCIHLVTPLSLGVIGFLLTTTTSEKYSQYTGAFISVVGMTNCIPIVFAWLNANMIGSTKSGTASAMVVSFGNIGGIVAGQLFRPYEAPRFIKSNLTMLVLALISLILSVILRHCLIWENFKLDQLRAEEDHKWEREDGLDIRNFNYML
jgi:MFS family permease